MTYPCITTTGGTDCAVLRASDLLCYDFSTGEWIKLEYGDIGFYSVSDKDGNITADYLRNTYGKVESKEHAELIVKLVEGAGFDVDEYHQIDKWFCFSEDYLFFLSEEFTASDSGEKLITLPLPPKESEEWPAVGDEVSFPSGKGILFVDKPDINGVVIVKSTDAESIDEYKKVSLNAVKKPPTPEEELANKLDEATSATIEIDDLINLSKAIINGEIKGLSYKPD